MFNSHSADPFADKAAWLNLHEIICRIEPEFDFSDKDALVEMYSLLEEKVTVVPEVAKDGFWLNFTSYEFPALSSRWVLETVVNDNIILSNMYRYDLIASFTVNGVQYAKFSDGLIVKISFTWDDKMFDLYNKFYGNEKI